MSSMVSCANGDLRTLPDLDLCLHRRRNPSRCQRMIVSGFTRSNCRRRWDALKSAAVVSVLADRAVLLARVAAVAGAV
jgi:hypothetical protein